MTSEAFREAVHHDPVWRDRSNFIIASDIDPGSTNVRTEQLWVRQLGPFEFEMCCIPFFVYDLALGDVVETDAAYLVQRVLQQSGHYTFRVAIKRSFHDEVAAQLKQLDALVEWSSTNLLGVDAVDADHAQRVADFLARCEARGELVYETGRLS